MLRATLDAAFGHPPLQAMMTAFNEAPCGRQRNVACNGLHAVAATGTCCGDTPPTNVRACRAPRVVSATPGAACRARRAARRSPDVARLAESAARNSQAKSWSNPRPTQRKAGRAQLKLGRNQRRTRRASRTPLHTARPEFVESNPKLTEPNSSLVQTRPNCGRTRTPTGQSKSKLQSNPAQQIAEPSPNLLIRTQTKPSPSTPAQLCSHKVQLGTSPTHIWSSRTRLTLAECNPNNAKADPNWVGPNPEFRHIHSTRCRSPKSSRCQARFDRSHLKFGRVRPQIRRIRPQTWAKPILLSPARYARHPL